MSVIPTHGKSGFTINFTNSDTFPYNAPKISLLLQSSLNSSLRNDRFPILIKQSSDIRQTYFSDFEFSSISVVQFWLLSFPWNIFHTSLLAKAINHRRNCSMWYFQPSWYFSLLYFRICTELQQLLSDLCLILPEKQPCFLHWRYAAVDKLYDVCICIQITSLLPSHARNKTRK